MTQAVFWLLWIGLGPGLGAVIASARGMEWWVGALLGVFGCFGLVIVMVMKPTGNRTPHLPPPPAAARWAADPTRRHELRLWDGSCWTGHVSDRGTSSWDPLG